MDIETRARIQDLEAGRRGPVGTVTLGTGATSTVVTTRACSSNSHITLTKRGSGVPANTINGVTPAKGSFTIYHTASGAPDTYSYEVSSALNS